MALRKKLVNKIKTITNREKINGGNSCRMTYFERRRIGKVTLVDPFSQNTHFSFRFGFSNLIGYN